MIPAETDLQQATVLKAERTSARLMSIDALRGFDMFWIIGAGALVSALHSMARTPATEFFRTQLTHVAWEGFRFYDLIFPLFIFISGVSMPFSLGKLLEHQGLKAALTRVGRRAFLLYLAGIFYSGGVTNVWPDIRLTGVLHLIAFSYLFAGLLFCCLKARYLGLCCVVLLGGYWAVLTFVPIRDITLTKPALAARAEAAGNAAAVKAFEAPDNPSTIRDSATMAAARQMYNETTTTVKGQFEPGRNVSNHLDFLYLPGRKIDNFFEAQGLLSPISGTVLCLAGAVAGLLLRKTSTPDLRKAGVFLAAGVACAALGWLWSLQMPVIKKIWTPSYVMITIGYSACLLAVFYAVVDVWRIRVWCQPFVWMGMNSITIYLTANILGGFGKIATRFAGGDVKRFFDSTVATGFGNLVIALVGLTLAFCLVHFLYRRKIFLRL